MKLEKNIRQRKDGRFEARYIKGRNEQGKTIYGSCYGQTIEEAIEKRDKALEIKCINDYRPKGINLLILGAGSHGQEVYEIASSLHIFSKIDFLDDDESNDKAIGNWGAIEDFAQEYAAAIVAVGNEALRRLWFSKLTQAGYVIPSLVHPSAIVSQTAELGIGSVICARAAISPGAQIGNGCIISAGVAVARDTKVPDWTHIDVGGTVNWHAKATNA